MKLNRFINKLEGTGPFTVVKLRVFYFLIIQRNCSLNRFIREGSEKDG